LEAENIKRKTSHKKIDIRKFAGKFQNQSSKDKRDKDCETSACQDSPSPRDVGQCCDICGKNNNSHITKIQSTLEFQKKFQTQRHDTKDQSGDNNMYQKGSHL